MSPRKVNATARRNATRKVALVVFSTLRQIGKSKGVTLKKIYQYIKDQYPDSSSNMIRLSNTIQKALAFGAVNKKAGNRLVILFKFHISIITLFNKKKVVEKYQTFIDMFLGNQ